MSLVPQRGHRALRRGRASAAGADYFLTLCTDQRRSGLTTPAVGGPILSETLAMNADQTWKLRCMVIMPDHLHLLLTLGERLSLGRTIQRLKARTSAALHANGIAWERDFFDHRMRHDEDVTPVFLYIYLNPYRKNLCSRLDRWPWFYCCEDDWAWFEQYLDADLPAPEWLAL